jgi:hypothetical protein
MLFQLHIPKTAGTSLFSVLSAAVYPGRYHVALSEQELRERTTGYALLSGHFGWDVLDLFPERPQVLTVLRDPVELILSLYGYWRAHAHEGIFSPKIQQGADEAVSRSIDELLLDPNSQLRANLGTMMGYLAGVEAISAGRGLEAALRHLDSCAWVATTQTLDRDVRVLPAMFGLNPMAEVPRHLATPERPQRIDIGREALGVIETLAEADRILYERARAIAEEQQRLYG